MYDILNRIGPGINIAKVRVVILGTEGDNLSYGFTILPYLGSSIMDWQREMVIRK